MSLHRITAGVAAALVFGIGVAAALADTPPTTTDTTTAAAAPGGATTASTTTTATTTTTVPETTTSTTTTTGAAPQTTTATTTAATTTAAAPAKPATAAHALGVARACPIAAVVLLLPNRAPAALGPTADAHTSAAELDGVDYPADGSIATASSATLHESTCTGEGPRSGEAQLHDVSLFGGEVTAARVALTLGATASASVDGLAVDGKAVVGLGEERAPLQAWGYIVSRPKLPVQIGDGQAVAALVVHVLQQHDGLPAGTTMLLAAGARPTPPAPSSTTTTAPNRAAPTPHPQKAHEHKTHEHTTHAGAAHRPAKATPSPRKQSRAPVHQHSAHPHSAHRHSAHRRSAHRHSAHRHSAHQHKPRRHAAAHRRKKRAGAGHEPLKVTPRLGHHDYFFPVAGPADYVDTYGGFRGDVPGNWHHGDDIFAPLGTPVVAVARGTINRVGWERLGGWRLWVRDSIGDEFYYAHLSGYAPADLRSNRVEAGQVIGFVGNSGDAFTTSPHLHFEIHPRRLLHLAYDGAVDPTTYLAGWTRLEHVDAPRPVHPPLPEEPVIRNEARYIFRELLAARHLIRHAPKPSRRPHVPIPADARDARVAAPLPIHEAAPTTKGHAESSTAALASLAVLTVLALVTVAMLWRSRESN